MSVEGCEACESGCACQDLLDLLERTPGSDRPAADTAEFTDK